MPGDRIRLVFWVGDGARPGCDGGGPGVVVSVLWPAKTRGHSSSRGSQPRLSDQPRVDKGFGQNRWRVAKRQDGGVFRPRVRG